MYALVGLPDPLHGQIRTSDPTFDLYAIEGLDRDVVKLAVLIIVSSPQTADQRGADPGAGLRVLPVAVDVRFGRSSRPPARSNPHL
jgi:hypothetical protein